MKTDTEKLIRGLRSLGLFINDSQPGICKSMQEAADKLEELEELEGALRELLTVSDPLFSYGVKKLQAARARARKALGMDKR